VNCLRWHGRVQSHCFTVPGTRSTTRQSRCARFLRTLPKNSGPSVRRPSQAHGVNHFKGNSATWGDPVSDDEYAAALKIEETWSEEEPLLNR
jgi:hypothetical protein